MTFTSELILIRGLPGSGKSTLAKKLVEGFSFGGPGWWSHFENDMYHVDDHGNYNWKPENVAAAALWCQTSVQSALIDGESVVVSNTFTQNWEMDEYFTIAKGLNVPVTVLTCEGNFGSVHNVPEKTLRKMKQRWEPLKPHG